MTIYDVALRTAVSCDVYPNKTVYLHAGAKSGYKLLFNNARVGNKIDFGKVRKYFPGATAYELEDYFCYVHVSLNNA